MKKVIMFIFLIVLFSFSAGIAIGYTGGAHRAAESAKIISYTNESYEIQYDLIGIYEYK